MDTEITQEVDKDGASPLPYAARESDEAPSVSRNVQAATHLSTSCSPYRAFPLAINAHSTWKYWKSFNIYDANSNEKLFYVDVHTGYSGKTPLGTRPGFVLHNGPNLTDPVLAATGDESQMSARTYTFNSSSVIILPALDRGPNYVRMDTERMRGTPSKEHDATFVFSIEVGKRERRERFEWRKVKKGNDGNAKRGAFELVRLFTSASRSTLSVAGRSGGSGDDVDGQGQPNIDCETVARLALVPPWSTLTKLFTLELLGSAQSGKLGDRCVLTIVMTAIRLWALRVKGRTTKTFNNTAEKLHHN